MAPRGWPEPHRVIRAARPLRPRRRNACPASLFA